MFFLLKVPLLETLCFLIICLSLIKAQDDIYKKYNFRLPVDPNFLCPAPNYKCADGNVHFLCEQNITCKHYKQVKMTGLLKQIFIAGHNGLRNKVAWQWQVSNMNLLHWSRELETMANMYLRTCKINNDNCMVIGEPVLKVSQNYCLRRRLDERWPGRVVRAWYLEIGFNIDSLNTYLSETRNFSLMRNFSQMIWPSAEFVGCGAAEIAKDFYSVVCYYHPPFVLTDLQTEFKSGQPCSQCMRTRRVCSMDFLGLCGIDVEISAANNFFKFKAFPLLTSLLKFFII